MATKECNSKLLDAWSDLSGKVVMVTGASSGLGLEFCVDLAKAGCKIIAAARRIDRLRSLCHEINGWSSGGSSSSDVRAVAIELDVSANGPAIEAAVSRAWNAFGRIDALINNAGIRGSVHGPLNLSEEEWDNIYNTNLKGTWLVSKYVCLHMCDSKLGGSVINISSIAGLNHGYLPGGLAYASSKTAVNTVSKIFAIELGIHNIRVNTICPGIFKSEITENFLQKDWVHNVASKIVPLKKFGSTYPELTSLLRYLIHDASKYVSGNNFVVDGGYSLPGVPIFSSL